MKFELGDKVKVVDWHGSTGSMLRDACYGDTEFIWHVSGWRKETENHIDPLYFLVEFPRGCLESRLVLVERRNHNIMPPPEASLEEIELAQDIFRGIDGKV